MCLRFGGIGPKCWHQIKFDGQDKVTIVKIKIWGRVKPYHMDTIMEHTKGQIMHIEFNENGLIKHLRQHYN